MKSSIEDQNQEFFKENAFQIDVHLNHIAIQHIDDSIPIQVEFVSAPSGDSMRKIKQTLFEEGPQMSQLEELEVGLNLYSGIILESEPLLIVAKLTVGYEEDAVVYNFMLEINDPVEMVQGEPMEYVFVSLFREDNEGPMLSVWLHGESTHIGEEEIIDKGEHIAHKLLFKEFEMNKYGQPMSDEFIQEELMSVNDWHHTLSNMQPPADDWFERALEVPIGLYGEEVMDLEMIENPAPEGSFGYISDAIHIYEMNPEEPMDILLPLHGETEVDRESIQIFKWNEVMSSWDLLEFSFAHPEYDVAWTKIYAPGTYIAVGMPSDPSVKLVVSLFSELTPMIRSARAAGHEAMIVSQICQYILCGPQLLRPAIAQTLNGTFEMAQLAPDEEGLIKQYYAEIENPPVERAGMPGENVPETGHGGSPLPTTRRHTVGGQRMPKGTPREFAMGGGSNICEKCFGIQFPDKIPEKKLKRPYVWNPFKPTVYTPRPSGPVYITIWSEVPMSFPTNVIRDLAIDPDDSNRIYVAAQRGGVWKSIDGGKYWTATTDHLVNLNAYAITIARKKKAGAKFRTVYFGTKDNLLSKDHDIYASEDGGSSWNYLTKIKATEIWELATAKDDEKVIYAATNNGLYKSTDGGKTWPVAKCKIDGVERTNKNGILDVRCYDLCIDPTDDKVIWVCAYKIGILTSKDAGKTWSNMTKTVKTMKVNVRTQIDIGQDTSSSGHGSDFVVAKSRKNIAYTLDGGKTWKELPNAVNTTTQDGWCSTLAVCPSNENFVTIGGFWQYYTTNLKDNSPKWTLVSDHYWAPWSAPGRKNEYHPDQQIVRFDPNDHTRFFLGNDGGVARIDSNGTKTLRISDGINANQLFYMDVSQTGNFEIGTSTYHCGIVRKEPGSSSVWKYVEVAEGGIYRIDPYYSKLHFCAPWGQGLRRSEKSGKQHTWKGVRQNKKKVSVREFEFRPGASREIWAGAYNDQLQYSTDRGLTWARVQDKKGNTLKLDGKDTNHAGVSAIAFDPSDDKIIYIGTSGGRIWHSKKAGKMNADWSQLSSLPKTALNKIDYWNKRTISAIAIHPKKQDHMYVGYSLNNEHTLYQTTDGGKNWTQSHGVSTKGGRLPQFPVVDIIIDPNNPKKIFVALQFGVYYSIDGGTFWHAHHSGLPKVYLREMRLRKSTRTLFIATGGRGIFHAQI